MTQPQQPEPTPTPTPQITYPEGPPEDLQPFPMYPEMAPNPDGTFQVPQYPPYIPESQFDASQGMPRSTVDGVHGTTGDDPVRWSPSHPGELPPYWTKDYVQDTGDPNLWWPDGTPGGPRLPRQEGAFPVRVRLDGNGTPRLWTSSSTWTRASAAGLACGTDRSVHAEHSYRPPIPFEAGRPGRRPGACDLGHPKG